MPVHRSQAELAGEFITGTLDDDTTVDFERCLNEDADLRILTEEWTTRIDGFVGTLVSAVIGGRSAAGRPWVEITKGISIQETQWFIFYHSGCMADYVSSGPNWKRASAVSPRPSG